MRASVAKSRRCAFKSGSLKNLRQNAKYEAQSMKILKDRLPDMVLEFLESKELEERMHLATKNRGHSSGPRSPNPSTDSAPGSDDINYKDAGSKHDGLGGGSRRSSSPLTVTSLLDAFGNVISRSAGKGRSSGGKNSGNNSSDYNETSSSAPSLAPSNDLQVLKTALDSVSNLELRSAEGEVRPAEGTITDGKAGSTGEERSSSKERGRNYEKVAPQAPKPLWALGKTKTPKRDPGKPRLGQRRIDKAAARRFILHALVQQGVKIDRKLLRGPKASRDSQAASLTAGSKKIRRCSSCTRPLRDNVPLDIWVCFRCVDPTMLPAHYQTVHYENTAATATVNRDSPATTSNTGAKESTGAVKAIDDQHKDDAVSWSFGDYDQEKETCNSHPVEVEFDEEKHDKKSHHTPENSEESRTAMQLVATVARVLISRSYNAFFSNLPNWPAQCKEARINDFLDGTLQRSRMMKQRRRTSRPPPLVRQGSISKLQPFMSNLSLSPDESPCSTTASSKPSISPETTGFKSKLGSIVRANYGEIVVKPIIAAGGAASASAKYPRPRSGHSATRVPGAVAILGGFTKGHGADGFIGMDHSMVLDTQTLRWSKIPIVAAGTHCNRQAPTPRCDHSATFFRSERAGNHIFMFGGKSATSVSNELFDLNLATSSWRKCVSSRGTVPRSRYGHSGCPLMDKQGQLHLFVFGGKDLTVELNDCFLYNLSCDKWTRVRTGGSIPCPRAYHSSLAVPCSNPDRAFRSNMYHGANSSSGGGGGVSNDRDYKRGNARLRPRTTSTAATATTNKSRSCRVDGRIHASSTRERLQGNAIGTAPPARPSEAIIVYGGCTGSNGLPMHDDPEVLGDLYLLFPSTWEWKEIRVSSASASPPSSSIEALQGPPPRYRHTFSLLPGSVSGNGRYLLFGGCGKDGAALNDAWILNNLKDTWWWSQIKSDPTLPPFSGHCTIVASGRSEERKGEERNERIFSSIVFFGGDMDGDEVDSDCEDDARAHYSMNCIRCLELKE